MARKNIILMCLDDSVAFWKYRHVFGAELKTPHLNAILGQSIRFDAAYCQAPVCSPSRASFLSGKTPHQTGVFNHDDRFHKHLDVKTMWPAQLKNAGYFCSPGGKLHHARHFPAHVTKALYSDQPKRFGSLGGHPPKPSSKSFGGFRGGFGLTDAADFDKLYDVQSANDAIAFLQGYNDPQPFYREIGFSSPHGPFVTPAYCKEAYDPSMFKRPDAWSKPIPHCPAIDRLAPPTLPFAPEVLPFWQQSVRNYFSALTHVDEEIGRVWAALKASPHADNTLVILTSDHGFHLGERDRWRKSTLYEQVCNIPLILHDPALAQARTISEPVASLDIGPTIFDWLGLLAPEGNAGRSLLPYLCGNAPEDRAVPTFNGDNVGIRYKQYRLIRYADGSTEFFNVSEDPWQYTELGQNHPDFQEIYDILREICAESGLDIPDVKPFPSHSQTL